MVKKRSREEIKLLIIALLAVMSIAALAIITSTEFATGASGAFIRKSQTNVLNKVVSQKCVHLCYPYEPIKYTGSHGNIVSCLCKEG